MTNRKWFGTDGLRGEFGTGWLQPHKVVQLAQAAAVVLLKLFPEIHTEICLDAIVRGTSVVEASLLKQDLSHPEAIDELPMVRRAIVIGRDTRQSGPVLEYALAAGFAAMGLEVYLVGVVPTPLLAQLTRELSAVAGVMISASHNPHPDNGLKLFDAYGFKLSDKAELAIEQQLLHPMGSLQPQPACAIIQQLPSHIDLHYRQQAHSLFIEKLPLQGLTIVVDGANGASYALLPSILRELGAEVLSFADAPDGVNINQDCGSTQPDNLRMLMLTRDADVGIAVDGDGDRLLMADASGQLYDGDALLYILATCPRYGQSVSGVVGTEMSNYGLEQALAEAGIPFQRAAVGDRYVLAELSQRGWQLGGENSGHIIDLGIMTTGDATLAALSILRAMINSGKTLEELTAKLQLCRQQLTNIPCQHAIDLDHPLIIQAGVEATTLLGSHGRYLLRFSGTQPLLRLMVEADQDALLQQAHDVLFAAIEQVMCQASDPL